MALPQRMGLLSRVQLLEACTLLPLNHQMQATAELAPLEQRQHLRHMGCQKEFQQAIQLAAARPREYLKQFWVIILLPKLVNTYIRLHRLRRQRDWTYLCQ